MFSINAEKIVPNFASETTNIILTLKNFNICLGSHVQKITQLRTTAGTSMASPKSPTVPPMTPHRAAHHHHPEHGMTISMSANTSLPAVISTLANLHHSPLL